MSFTQGINGMAAAATNLDVIGNNIANSGTFGFKSGKVTFQDMFAGSSVGLGAGVSGVIQDFAQGSLATTNRPLDAAIVSGNGLFRMASETGEIGYSRNGQFTINKDGYIVNAAGLRLTGHAVSIAGGLAGGSPTELQIPPSAMQPNATTSISSQFNLDARSTAVPAGTQFSVANTGSYNYSNSINVFDSLGKQHEQTVFFAKTGNNSWDVYSTTDGVPVNAGAAVASLVFDQGGKLIAPVGGQFNMAGLAVPGGGAPLNIAIDLSGSTQFGDVNAVNKLTQDGYTAGTLNSFSINHEGVITGKYSNEQSSVLGQIVLATFTNPNGLEPNSHNVWKETSLSGPPLIGEPGIGTKQGSLAPGALEASNVDLTSELVNLIEAQRSYQANAQTLKTQDQVMQALINMR